MGANEQPPAANGPLRTDDCATDRDLGPDRLVAEAELRSAHAFLVDTTQGRNVGVVEDVIVDPATGRVVQLDVRGGWFGRRHAVIDVRHVRDIRSALRRIVVDEDAVPDEQR